MVGNNPKISFDIIKHEGCHEKKSMKMSKMQNKWKKSIVHFSDNVNLYILA